MAKPDAALPASASKIVHSPGLSAWAVSIALHLLILTAFWLVRFPRASSPARAGAVPQTDVARVERAMQLAPILPKPQVRLPAAAANDAAAYASPLLPANEPTPDAAGSSPLLQPASPDDADTARAAAWIEPPPLRSRVEFFGSPACHRRICYVVDSSGSMTGLFAAVRSRLKQSIRELQPDQYFHVLFFGNGKLAESSPSRMQRATEAGKAAVEQFIDSIQPAGKTNAMPAFERAVAVRDARGNPPAVIYFLTDGFDLSADDAESFARRVANLIAQSAPKAQINTIGFWPQDADRKTLRTLADRTGGACTIVTDQQTEPPTSNTKTQ